ncbi:MAG: cupin domain-containing protein [Alphaproteobacteria bacterium]|nr:cupin domain-containing protein [Alphaproteobacteria bacterium]
MKTEPSRIVDSPVGTMERVLTEKGFDPESRAPTVFTMESPIPEQGNDRTYLAHTDQFNLFLMVFGPEDGENRMHAHTNEDHAFVVLEGAAEFHGPDGEVAKLRRNQGIMLPRGSFYTFAAMNGEPLVLLRIGAQVDPDKSAYARIVEDGSEVVGSSSDNNAVACIFKPGAFFR